MKKKTVKRVSKAQKVFATEKEYWDYYATRSFVYKQIDIGHWKQYFQDVLVKHPEDQMAQNMIKKCLEEEISLSDIKKEQIKILDESLLKRDYVNVSRKAKK